MFSGVFGGQQWPCLPSSGALFQLPCSSCRSFRFTEAHGPLGVWSSRDTGSPSFVPGSDSGS